MTDPADRIHTLADLATWSFPGTSLAVVGRPIAHTLSPVIHNAALAALGDTQPRFQSWRYFKFDVAPAELPSALDLFHRRRFHGLNLTVPHKSLAVAHLAASDPFVQAAGAANTLSYAESGWRGANTDGFGLAEALRQEFGLGLENSTVILLGAGGAARAAAVECLRSRCAELWIGNRTAATVQQLLAELRAGAGESRLHSFDLAQPPAGLPAAALVINATSLGLGANDPAPIDLRRLPSPTQVYDMIYRPPQTALLRQAAELGIIHANGLSMLIHQAARSLAMWTETTVPVAVMTAAAHRALTLP